MESISKKLQRNVRLICAKKRGFILLPVITQLPALVMLIMVMSMLLMSFIGIWRNYLAYWQLQNETLELMERITDELKYSQRPETITEPKIYRDNVFIRSYRRECYYMGRRHQNLYRVSLIFDLYEHEVFREDYKETVEYGQKYLWGDKQPLTDKSIIASQHSFECTVTALPHDLWEVHLYGKILGKALGIELVNRIKIRGDRINDES